MQKNVKLSFLLILLTILFSANAERNRLIRVDGINPTCYRKPECREYDIVGAVISVDKSLPYMGSNMCCITFNMVTETEYENDAYFMGRVLNSTVLEGDDFITFFDENFNLVRNFSANDLDVYKPIYFNSPRISVEIYKDRNYRSIYEIVISVYYEGTSAMCRKDNLLRCEPGTNSSICVDQELTCDKFPHCPTESDEEFCGNPHETTMSYDKMTISIVLLLISSVIVMTLLLILLLCFCKSKDKLTETFLSIFGHRNNSKNSRMLDIDHAFLNSSDQKFSLINEKSRSSFKSFKVTLKILDLNLSIIQVRSAIQETCKLICLSV